MRWVESDHTSLSFHITNTSIKILKLPVRVIYMKWLEKTDETPDEINEGISSA